ncbi:cell wall hydrolase [Sphingomonas jatrophae]|uniref:Cell Wall Hydrolase n=1 Tax=Sphingomonas jatrophae TaxID=1166337 RepID=A0A1I6MAF6_9SPHN|nr:cell wall hydrolase [Sphingomonas jatrophae]SFS12695.1 Cell Wall Hydrolase [Sphingomonas jatrophae]
MRTARRQNAKPLASLAALAAFVAIPATLSFMAEAADAQSLAAGLLPAAALPTADAAATRATLRLADDALPALLAGDSVVTGVDLGDAEQRASASDADLVCMAKVIVHEARNQPRAGQLAVAQLIMARVRTGRFADSVCGVVNQPGQFFNTAAYEPAREGAAWATAVAVSREALEGAADPVAPGALFYHAAYQAPTSFFRGRQRVATLGDHIFYR